MVRKLTHLHRPEPWIQLMRDNPHTWKARSKRVFIHASRLQVKLGNIYSIVASNIEEPPLLVPFGDEYGEGAASVPTNPDELPFQCEHCPAKFKANQGLAVHLLRHHGIVPPPLS
eukprot:6483070-Amphidinium_carterae.3